MIVVRDACKRFKLYERPADRLKEIVLRRPYHHLYTALDGISLHVDEGETLGVIGRNGAGKSTLLKLLTGVLLPDHGQVSINGAITGLLELGTGFDPDLTGEQNIGVNGLLLGMNADELGARRERIVEFSELGEFIREPLRTYSSGMVMRLAFSIAIHAEPKAFVVDEALSVGDAHFQQKCMRKIHEFREAGGSIVFVSHDLNAVKMLCDRVVVLERGAVVETGDPETAVNAYNRLLSGSSESAAVEVQEAAYGSREAEITEIRVRGRESGTETFASGEDTLIEIGVRANTEIAEATLGIMIRDRFGQDIYGINSHYLQYPIRLPASSERVFEYSLNMSIAPGKYTLTVALHDEMDHTGRCFHWWDNAVRFEVAGIKGTFFSGIADLGASLHEKEEVSTEKGEVEERQYA